MAEAVPIQDFMDASTNVTDVQLDQNQDKNIIKLVNTLLSRAKRKRSRQDIRWNEFEDFFRGKQWPIERPRWKFSEAINICWPTIWSTTAIMTDARPEIEFAATEPSDLAWSEILTKIQKSNWEKYNWGFVLTDGIVDAQKIDAAHYYVGWDPTLENGLGDICFETLDTYYCYPDPLATDIHDARYFIYAKPIPTSKLKAKYPKFKEKIHGDIIDMGGSGSHSGFSPSIDLGILGASTFGSASSLSSSPRVDAGGEPLTMLIRCWLKDDALEQTEQEKDGQKLYLLKKKFPKGRYIEIACNELLRDSENGVEINGKVIPYEDGKFPIVKLVDHSHPREYWGAGEIEQLKGPQRVVDYLWAFCIDHVRMAGNPQWFVSNRSGIDPANITNEPGIVIEGNNIDSNDVRREAGEAMPAGLLEMFNLALGMPDKVSGIQDVTRGATQPGVTSGLMLEGYVEASQTRIRLKNRNLDKALREIGDLMLSRMLQFYSGPRMARITNKEGAPQFVEFSIQNDANRKVFNFAQAQQAANGIMMGPGQKMEIKGVPDVTVSTGSSLPFAKAQKSAVAKELFAAGAIDQEELLTSLDWPNAEKVILRMQEAAAQQAQQEAMMGPPPGGK